MDTDTSLTRPINKTNETNKLPPSSPTSTPTTKPLNDSTTTPTIEPTDTPMQIFIPSAAPTFVPMSFNPVEEVVPQVNHNELSETLTKKAKQYVGSKFNSPMALSFVMGKERAKKKINDVKMSCIAKIDNEIDYEDIVKNHIYDQIELLQNANLYLDGYKFVIDDKDRQESCSPHQINCIRNKCKFLALFLHLLLGDYETTDNLLSIAKSTADKINQIHLIDFLPSKKRCKNNFIIRDPKMILDWYRNFCDKDCFVNPGKVKTNKVKVPSLLNANPDLHKAIIHFCRENINTLTVDDVHSFLLTDALPKLAAEIREERKLDLHMYNIDHLLAEYGLRTLNVRTVQNWMKNLGFKYEPRRKTYYVDSHESKENVKYRSKFIEKYFEYEILAYRWYSITPDTRQQMIEMGKISSEIGYKYEVEGETYYEYHVDDHPDFQMACEHLEFGGNLSVRKPPDKKPIQMWGQDEAIMKQYLFTLLSWTLPDGSKPLVPKDEGDGVMLSAFTSRELGFGFTVPPNILDEVNKKRENEKYSDEDAATILFGTAKKTKLTTSPFVRELEYGANKEGYWTYDNMLVQFEDCVDVLKVMYPQFDFVFLLDHSNGHDHLRPNGLNLNKISVRYGGKQPIMRDAVIDDPTLFGPFHDATYKLQLGSTQKMQFDEFDEGPCYLDESERHNSRNDIDTGKVRRKEVLKLDLIKALKSKGVGDPCGNKDKIRELAVKHNIPLEFDSPIIKEGWVGKAKGSLQILYERGWVDPTKIRKYTAKGPKITNKLNTGTKENPYSINELMQKQSDFQSELTLLQYHAQKLGVALERSPKCHPEIAGEGIEYGWALSKMDYRQSLMAAKKSKESFQKLVKKCTDNSTTLSVKRMRYCSKRARDYMVLYQAVEKMNLDDEDGIGIQMNKHAILEGSMKLYRRLQKTKKTHRSVIENQLYEVRLIEKECPIVAVECKKEELIHKVVNKMVTL